MTNAKFNVEVKDKEGTILQSQRYDAFTRIADYQLSSLNPDQSLSSSNKDVK